MGNTEHLYLRFVRFKALDNWSVSHILGMNMGFTDMFPMIPIGQIIDRCTELVTVENEIQYKQITLKTNGGGAVLRDVKLGKDIGTKKQYAVSSGQFIMSKIDARNGAFGVVPDELDGAIVTADFPVFNVNQEKIIPQYLFLLSSTKAFARFAQSCSRGTTNRQRIDIALFLSQRIPLPSLTEQKIIVSNYNTKIQQAEDLEKKSIQIEKDIETYLLESLGISQNEEVKDKEKNLFKFLKFIQFKDIDRWDCYNRELSFLSELKESPYPLVEIGKVYNFVKRNWDKKESKFRYVEIGSVDSSNGIMFAEEMTTSKAPSRATQKIKNGDLIIGTTRPYLRKFAIVNIKYDDCVCSSGFQVVAPSNLYSVSFLYEYLKTTAAIDQMALYMSGALYPSITSKDLKKVLMPLPPLETQNAIVEHINEQKTQIKQLKQQAEILRKEALVEFEKEIFKS